MILLYSSMPGLVAQGLLFFGFIYCMAYAIHFIEYIFKKKRQPTSNTTNKEEKKLAKPEPLKVKTKKPKYKFLLKIKSDLAKNKSNYNFLDIKSVQIADKEICFNEVFVSSRNALSIGEIEENIISYWMLEIDDFNLDETKLKFICVSKDEKCNALSIYSASEICYNNQRNRIQRIEDLRYLEGYKSSTAFDNWIKVNGLNEKPSIIDSANRRIMNE